MCKWRIMLRKWDFKLTFSKDITQTAARSWLRITTHDVVVYVTVDDYITFFIRFAHRYHVRFALQYHRFVKNNGVKSGNKETARQSVTNVKSFFCPDAKAVRADILGFGFDSRAVGTIQNFYGPMHTKTGGPAHLRWFVIRAMRPCHPCNRRPFPQTIALSLPKCIRGYCIPSAQARHLAQWFWGNKVVLNDQL